MSPVTQDPTLVAHIAARNAAITAELGAHAPVFLAVLQDRADRFAAHIATMNFSPAMAQWALAMERRFGRYVRAHHFIADWTTALLIVRYGEEPDAARSTDPTFTGWPTTFTDADLARAQAMLNGSLGTSLTLLSTES